MSLFSAAKRVLFGKPIHTKHAHHERLPKVFALPVFASDALSSVAYATQEIMAQLLFAGVAFFSLAMPISIAIVVLLIIVAASYYQTIHAYPLGGGSYRVSTDNLGSVAGRVAGASLLIDYVLTVAVSVSAGVAAIISMAPALQPHIVLMGVIAVAIVGVLNLRGAKESGVVFAIPTYSFVALIVVMIVWGVVRGGNPGPSPIPTPEHAGTHTMNLFLICRAFAAGCTALTGVEAISDGVQAFKAPEAKNASQTLAAMAIILCSMFLGITWLAHMYPVMPMNEHAPGYMTVVAQIASQIFPHWLFIALQVATALILILAANTAFADFPRLSSFIARDGYLPRQLATVGDRLVFQNGIILLSLVAIVLIVMFRGETSRLIPLYAVGVFTSFTLSQAGMVVMLTKKGAALWKRGISAVGCSITFVVMGIILVTKFEEGAYLIVAALAVLLSLFWAIRRHYDYLARELSVGPEDRVREVKTTVLLLVPRLHRGILKAIAYSKAMSKDVRAIHVTIDPKSVGQIKEDWNRFGADIPLVILDSPYRSFVEPITDYIDQTVAEDPNMVITVIVPQAVPKYWWQGLLHNNAAVPLKMALQSRKNVVITNVRYFLK